MQSILLDDAIHPRCHEQHLWACASEPFSCSVNSRWTAARVVGRAAAAPSPVALPTH